MPPISLKLGAVLLLFFIALFFSGDLLSLYIHAIWFEEVGYLPVFLKILFTQISLGAIHTVGFFLILYPNLRAAERYRSGPRDLQAEPDPLAVMMKPLVLGGSLLLALIVGLQGANRWKEYLLLSNPTPFGTADPLYARDLGFYVFELPFISYLQGWLSSSVMMVLLFCALIYFYRQGIRMDPRGLFVDRGPRRHLILLGAAYMALLAWGYYLDFYDLLYSPRGVVYGAVYADTHGRLPMLWVVMFFSLGAAAVLAWSAARRGLATPALAIGSVFLVHLVGGTVYPEFLHRFQVAPNEIVMEKPYIEHNIEATRFAYGLHRIESQEFPAAENLTAAAVNKNSLTTQNIRLWDHRPLLATYQQLQQIRTYYNFVDVDNDRYVVDGEYRQLMLSPRELSYANLPGRTWINEHLTYTHGYGVTVGPVSRISKEGLPEFFIKDIPPKATTNIQVTRPEIYYGEIPNDYIFTRTQAKEFDYPAGAENVYTTYTGEGGVPVESFLRKIALSAYFGSLKIILSNDIKPDSRIMYFRNITERIQKIAPFLTYDRDPYLVITEEGQLIWMIDGYTTTDKIPYSQPLPRLGNYMRNSVKVTVDAFHGTVRFYISDTEDPVIQSYAQIFPGMFLTLQEMPRDLRAHIRYPQDFFRVQAHMYTTYHMQDPQIFYNKEDLWNIPQKDNRDMEPYYTIMKLPGEAKEEFILMVPFTPAKRDNLSAWLAARSDGAHYGKLFVYIFPKQRLIFGPRQIENRIDQDAYISQQLTLWGQRGSQVIRGSLLVIPIENSLIYVSPLYLASAAAGSLPELRRVITAFGNRLVMEENLEASLNSLFEGQAVSGLFAQPLPIDRKKGADELIPSALEAYRRSQELLRSGRWSEYGQAVQQLESILNELANRVGKE